MTVRAEKGSSAPHICIVLLSGLGDVIHGLPLVNALKDSNPRVRITWVVEPMPAGILLGHPAVDNVIVYRRTQGVRGIRQLRRDLRAAGPFDLTLNLNVYFKSVWPALLSGAPRRIGFDRARSFDGVWLASNERLDPCAWAHTADMFFEFADHLDIQCHNPRWDIAFSSEELREQAELLDRFEGAPVATIVPASATVKKDWLADRWAAVADALESEFGFRVVIAGGPGAREQIIARDIVALAAARIEWAMGDSVRRLSWILGASDLVIAPDTGPVHIARALSVPVVGIYGHTNPWRVGPWRAFSDLWVDHYTEPGEEPDPSNRTPKLHRMPGIRVTEVLEHVQRAVDVYGAGKSLHSDQHSVRHD